MKEVRYMISDAAKKINVEPHVLRYWEEELEVGIPRNEMGHRYYREEHIQMMQGVKYLKERGFQLKSIKILLSDVDRVMQLPHRRLLELRDRLELAVSKEELRLQREEELRNCSAQQDEAEECTEEGGKLEEVDDITEGAGTKIEIAGEGEMPENFEMSAFGSENILTEITEDEMENNFKNKERTEKKRGCAEDSKKESGSETGKAAGKAMGNRMDKRGGKKEGAQTEAWQGTQPAGQAARLVEIWQSGQPTGQTSSQVKMQQEDCASTVVYESDQEEDEFQETLPEQSEQAAVRVSDNAVRMQQFRGIMNEIVTDAMRENNRELSGSIAASVSKEMEYHMRKREMMLEEHFKQLDRTLREYQLGQKQAAVARECGSRRESKFFRKNGKVRI